MSRFTFLLGRKNIYLSEGEDCRGGGRGARKILVFPYDRQVLRACTPFDYLLVVLQYFFTKQKKISPTGKLLLIFIYVLFSAFFFVTWEYCRYLSLQVKSEATHIPLCRY